MKLILTNVTSIIAKKEIFAKIDIGRKTWLRRSTQSIKVQERKRKKTKSVWWTLHKKKISNGFTKQWKKARIRMSRNRFRWCKKTKLRRSWSTPSKPKKKIGLWWVVWIKFSENRRTRQRNRRMSTNRRWLRMTSSNLRRWLTKIRKCFRERS
jgi:hypothetical protein